MQDLRGTAQWLAGFRRLLTNDTGIAHLAAAAGVEVIAISGSHFQGRFAVFGQNALTIFADVPCRRCSEKCIFDCAIYPCVSQIDPGSVAALVQQNLSGSQHLPPDSEFFGPDRLFNSLIEARQKRIYEDETRRIEIHEALRATQLHLKDAERQRDTSNELCQQAERQRDEWAALCHAAESSRDDWEALCHAAESARDEWEALCHAAESGRDDWKARWEAAE
ncbi:MAG: glycosyltransferase family 9 protein, partial [Isosphaeraceae bacterium]